MAIALGLGTMVGWKRIVVTIGEKIGKTHLTYAQGASAELVAMGTIVAADMFGLPVSTTHVLSSGVAGTMAANRSGLQMSTLRNLVDGLGADAAGRDPAFGHALLAVPPHLLGGNAACQRGGGSQIPSSMRPGSSRASLMATRNCTASRPSMMR